jgi:hypothetical protein
MPERHFYLLIVTLFISLIIAAAAKTLAVD